MMLAALALSLQIFTLPMVPETLVVPEDRAIYIAEHYWDSTPLSDELIKEYPTEYEQYLSDFLSILPILESKKQADVLRPLFAISNELLRKYLCSEDSPVSSPEIYKNSLKFFVSTIKKLVIHYYFQENCDLCKRNLEYIDQSKIINNSIADDRLEIHLVNTSEKPKIQLFDTSGKLLISDITIEEIEWILGQIEP